MLYEYERIIHIVPIHEDESLQHIQPIHIETVIPSEENVKLAKQAYKDIQEQPGNTPFFVSYYDRNAAVNYAKQRAFNRNPAFDYYE